MFIVLFASSFTHIVVQLFVAAGSSEPETSAFLSGTMKVLAWPVHSLFPSAWSEATFAQAILLLGLNSLIWGIVLGTLLFFLKRNRSNRTAM
jgi:NADH:ubiquinone oxidoreductase subunit 4 (subunit M)